MLVYQRVVCSSKNGDLGWIRPSQAWNHARIHCLVYTGDTSVHNPIKNGMITPYFHNHAHKPYNKYITGRFFVQPLACGILRSRLAPLPSLQAALGGTPALLEVCVACIAHQSWRVMNCWTSNHPMYLAYVYIYICMNRFISIGNIKKPIGFWGTETFGGIKWLEMIDMKRSWPGRWNKKD